MAWASRQLLGVVMVPSRVSALARGIVVVAAALAGCVVGPDYRPPAPSTPIGGATATVPNPSDQWWTVFHDATLNELVDAAVGHNPDLYRALASVAAARAERMEVAGAFYPEIDGSASALRGRQILLLPPGFGPKGGSAVASTNSLFRAGFDASWELDVFGRLRRNVDAAEANAQVAQEAANEVRLTLLGDVARFYVDARGLQRRIEITQATARAQQDTAELTAVRFRAGTGTGLDAVRAEAQWKSTLAELPALEAALRGDINHLSVLTGQPPATLGPSLSVAQPIPEAPSDSMSAGVPADILRRRPDIREQERLLEQATASIGVAVADLYPSLTLAGTIGINSPRLSTLHRTSLSGVWSIAPQLTLPLLDGGRRRAAVEVREAQLREAQAQYQSAVLHAEEEVENALTAYTTERDRRHALREAADRYKEALELSTELYVKGLGTFLDVLDSQRSLFQVQSELAVSEAGVSIDLIALYKALGGGWSNSPL
jgi:multidrug efflux system outer membrane protein